MQPVNFEQANKELLKPDTMTDEECGSLHVYTDGNVCISLWKMSLRERLFALIFGKLWLWVVSGATQPPVAIQAEKQIFSDMKA